MEMSATTACWKHTRTLHRGFCSLSIFPVVWKTSLNLQSRSLLAVAENCEVTVLPHVGVILIYSCSSSQHCSQTVQISQLAQLSEPFYKAAEWPTQQNLLFRWLVCIRHLFLRNTPQSRPLLTSHSLTKLLRWQGLYLSHALVKCGETQLL